MKRNLKLVALSGQKVKMFRSSLFVTIFFSELIIQQRSLNDKEFALTKCSRAR